MPGEGLASDLAAVIFHDVEMCNGCTFPAPVPVLHRIGTTTIRVNVSDHQPPHLHVVLADRRDALVMLDTLTVISRTLTARDIAPALAWIKANRDVCRALFEECNP